MKQKRSETLLFVHGMCHGSWCWEYYFVPYFNNLGYRCIAIDLPGHTIPGNQKSINHFTLQRYKKALLDAINGLETSPILIGHSMGGAIVQHIFNESHCKKAVLMASVPPSGSLKASIRVLKMYPGSIKHLLTGRLLKIAQQNQKLMFGDLMDSELQKLFTKKLCSESILAYLQLLVPVPFSASKNPPDVLVIGGDKDQLFRVTEFEHTAQTYNADLEIIPNGCHDLMLGPEWEKTAEAIHHWLSKG